MIKIKKHWLKHPINCTGYDHSGSNLGLAKWLEANHDNMRQIYFDDWAEIVAEQKPLIEQLMQRDNTNNPLSAVIPVCKTIPNGDMSRLLLLAVATEMITRGHNDKLRHSAPAKGSDNTKNV